MRSGRYLALAAAMLTAVPVMAAPVVAADSAQTMTNPAASLSVANTLRAGSKAHHESQFAFLLGALIFVAVGVGAAAAAGGFSSSSG